MKTRTERQAATIIRQDRVFNMIQKTPLEKLEKGGKGNGNRRHATYWKSKVSE